jgi:NADPH:quinone reductase-like Zn-dependent oxidoreductase
VLAYRISRHGEPTAREWIELAKPEPQPEEVLIYQEEKA